MRIGPQTRQSLQLSDSAVTFQDSAVSVVPLLLVDDNGFADGLMGTPRGIPAGTIGGAR